MATHETRHDTFPVDHFRDRYLDFFARMQRIAPPEIGGFETGLPNPMAAGLESLVGFVNLVYEDSPLASVTDVGAGVSSFVFRAAFGSVVSLDNHAPYLAKVARACEEAGLSSFGFAPNLDVMSPADYVFYDYSTDFGERLRRLPFAWERTRKALWVDDADDRPVRAEFLNGVVRFASSVGAEVDLRSDCVDEYGRFGCVLRRVK